MFCPVQRKNLYRGEQKLNNMVRLLFTAAGIGGGVWLTLNNDAAHNLSEIAPEDIKKYFPPIVVIILGRTMAAWTGGTIGKGLAKTGIAILTYLRYGVSNPHLVFDAHELAKEISESNPNQPLSEEEKNKLIKILKDLPKVMEKYKRRTVIYAEIKEALICVQEEKSIAALRTLIEILRIKSQNDKRELEAMASLLSIEEHLPHEGRPSRRYSF